MRILRMWRFFSVAFVFLLCSLGIYAEGQDVQQVVVAVEEAATDGGMPREGKS